MLYQLSETELLFNEQDHIYTLRREGFSDLILPSVSEIIEPIHRKSYGNIAESILDKAADRGSRVHRAIQFWNQYHFRNMEDDCSGFFDAYVQFRKEHADWKLSGSEQRFYHHSFLYAGTCDEVYYKENETILLDLKTPVKALLKTWAVQLGGYKAGLESAGQKVDKSYILQLYNDGHYILHEIKPDFSTFLACLQIHNFQED